MAIQDHFDLGQAFVLAALSWGLWLLYGIIYNLFLSPLAKFPGPKLAAITPWYEFYWDGIQPGQYYFRIEKMHKEFGPIVRIGPDQLHVSDPEFLMSIFAPSGKRRNKYAPAARIFGNSEASIATLDHELHRLRRGAAGKYFSKEGIRRAEPIIHGALARLFKRFEEHKQSEKPLTMSDANMALSSDVITEYCFAAPYNYLEHPDFNAAFWEMATSVHGMAPLARRVPWLMPMMDSLPSALVSRMDPGMAKFVQFREDIYNRIRTIQANKDHYETLSHKTVLHEILQSNLPESEKTVERLWQEANIYTFAGTETVAWTISVMTFYLLSMPEALKKLKMELNKAIPDPQKIPEWRELEKLPYLSAVIQESLRFSLGATTRQHRSCPDEAVIFDDGKKKWVIPPGTAIAMSNPIIHFNATIFPEPHRFDPERWLKNPGLERYMWSFSKGPRQCLGINLAYAELNLCTAALFRRYNGPSASKAEIKGDETGSIELFETTIDDVTFQRDMFAPYPKEGSKGVRILLK